MNEPEVSSGHKGITWKWREAIKRVFRREKPSLSQATAIPNSTPPSNDIDRVVANVPNVANGDNVTRIAAIPEEPLLIELSESDLGKVNNLRASLGLSPLTSFLGGKAQGYKKTLEEFNLSKRRNGKEEESSLNDFLATLSEDIESLEDEVGQMTDDERLKALVYIDASSDDDRTLTEGAGKWYGRLHKVASSYNQKRNYSPNRFYNELLTSMIFRKNGKIDFSLLGQAYDYKFDEDKRIGLYLPEEFLTQDDIERITPEEKRRWKFWSNLNSSNRWSAGLMWNTYLKDFVDENGDPNIRFFEEWVYHPKTPRAEWEFNQIPASLDSFPPEKAAFWKYWLEQPYGLKGPLLYDEHYYDVVQGEQINIEKVSSRVLNFIDNKHIGSWNDIGLFLYTAEALSNSSVKTKIFLSLFETIKTIKFEGLQRPEAEQIAGLNRALSKVFYSQMDPLQRQAWFLLRKAIPYGGTTANEFRMKGDAELVDELSHPLRDNVSWIRQLVHNFMHPLTPEIVDAFYNWLQTGEISYLTQIQGLLEKNVPSIKIPTNLLTEDGKRDAVLAWKGKEIANLRDSVKAFFKGDEREFRRVITRYKEDFPKDLLQDLELLDDTLKGIQTSTLDETKQTLQYLFLRDVTNARKNALRFIGKNPSLNSKNTILMMDNQLAYFYDVHFADYLQRYVIPSLRRNPPMKEDLQEAFEVLGFGMEMAELEGEISGMDELKVKYKSAVKSGNYDVVKDLIMRFLKQGELQQREFGVVVSIQMINVLKNNGLTDEEARKKMTHEHLPEIRKMTQLSKLEPLANELIRVLLPNSTPEANWVTAIAFNKDGSSLRKTALSYCRIILPEMIDKETGKVIFYERKVKGNKVVFLPSDDGEGINIFVNGQIVANPVKFMEENFEILPVMKNSLKEGD